MPFEAQLAAAEAELLRAKAQKTQADREAARLRPLAERKAIGQKEADDAASAAEFATAAIKAAQAKLSEAKLNLAYTRVTAPISGLSSRAQQSEGSLANANTTLLTTVSQVDPIWILFNISENEQLRLNKAMADGRLQLPRNNAFEVSVKLSDGSTFPRSGGSASPTRASTRRPAPHEMRAEIANADLALKPGQFVRVALKGAQRRGRWRCRRSPCSKGRRDSFTSSAGTRTARRSPRPGRWSSATGRRATAETSG
ncbi:MAG: efflux RND transporter periplasmic adaptor subunit [Candidatus Accumulibacter sp.]|nr:efflux RND transporter periplasmic adaptor subunit [Candidatus Accumulibacter propinquus]